MLEQYLKSCVDIILTNEDNKVLILQRGEKAPWMPLKWGLPGGHVDGNEKKIITAKRELFEETKISNAKNFQEGLTIIDYGVLLTYYKANINNPDVKLSYEHSDYAWVKVSDLKKYDFVPNLKIILKKHFNDIKQ